MPAAKLLQRALCTLPLVEHAAPLARRRASEGAANDMLALAGAVLPACSTTGRHLCNATRPVRSLIRLQLACLAQQAVLECKAAASALTAATCRDA